MPRESFEAKKARTLALLKTFKKIYPNAKCALDHKNPFELLVATILSAQCTDIRVNLTTPTLFKKYPDAKSLAAADTAVVEKMVQSCGFFRMKAKAIQAMSAELVEKYRGQVPGDMAKLVALRGVGRKTANVVLGNAFEKNEGVVVDTHVGRLSLRLGLTIQTDPVKVEQNLMKLVPRQEWALWSHLLIFHGRQVCEARNPKCDICAVNQLCPSAFKIGKWKEIGQSSTIIKGNKNRGQKTLD